ncbi:bifunctional folylpolyglutamate synthase/dihydrofolate synthase [Limibacillus halophilus]
MSRSSGRSDVILERLLGLHPKIIDLSLGRLERLLEKLGHPERKLAPVVHVAGTNGKGSTIAYLRAIAEAAGLKVQVYSSPHLVRFHERIRLTGGLIAEEALSELLEACEGANGGHPITFFEITTAAAFLAFSREEADLLLLEVGLGGRLDATNVIDRPALSVITPVSLDHQQYLGDTIEQIAFEKAGIIKAGVPCVIGPQSQPALAVMEKQAAGLSAPVSRCGKEWEITEAAGEEGYLFRWRGEAPRPVPRPNLYGRHQRENAGMALAAAELLAEAGFAIGRDAMDRGLTQAYWPGRMQRLTEGRFAELLPEGWELWLDGGHNESAGQALAASLAAWREKPLHLVYGMLNTKNAGGFLAPLAAHARTLKAVAIPGEANSLTAQEAARYALEQGFEAEPAESVAQALASILRTQAPKGPARILICGSLYLAGKVLAENEGD